MAVLAIFWSGVPQPSDDVRCIFSHRFLLLSLRTNLINLRCRSHFCHCESCAAAPKQSKYFITQRLNDVQHMSARKREHGVNSSNRLLIFASPQIASLRLATPVAQHCADVP
jgi:hypothetical protein